jgi:hypothetical protein
LPQIYDSGVAAVPCALHIDACKPSDMVYNSLVAGVTPLL